MRIVELELLKEVILRRFYTKTGLLLRHNLGSPVFFHYISFADYIGSTIELFSPKDGKLMILYSSVMNNREMLARLKIEDAGTFKDLSSIRSWGVEKSQNKILVKTFKQDVLRRWLLEGIYELSSDLYGWVNIGLVSEVDESRGMDMVERSLESQPLSPPLLV